MGLMEEYNIVESFLDELDELLFEDDNESTVYLTEYLEEHDLELKAVRTEYDEFLSWYNKMRNRIGAAGKYNKAVVCKCFIKYANSHPIDENIIKLWSVFFCDNADFLFIDFSNSFYEKYDSDDIMESNILSFLSLKEELSQISERIRSDIENNEKFIELISKITFTEEKCIDFDFEDFIGKFDKSFGDSEDYKDNLIFIADKISHSPQLSQIIPLVLNLIFIRRNEKMHSSGFEPNYTKILEYYKYKIEKNNRKNIDSFEEQIKSYINLRNHFDCCDPGLCDAGFNAVSNITDCELIDWEQYPELKRPLIKELRDNFFSCFADGYYENPYFLSKNINVHKLMRFNSFDMSAEPELRISENMFNYLRSNSEISDAYMKLLEKGEQDNCMSIIMKAAVNSGVSELITSRKADYAYTEIIECIHMDISIRICEELIDIGEKIMDNYRASIR
ncbi:MAG: hypothetical protein IJ446_08460 [Oscillospiraceae bacterium]|nr:hypothetical protein [Oscillospiraceae bacterium]